MADRSENGRFSDSTNVIELTGKIMVVAIILLFFVVVFVFCLHIYAKRFWYRRRDNNPTTTTTGRRHQEITTEPALRRGLEPSALKTIPVIVFDPKDFKEGLECAVCLSEVSEGEKARLLPKCNHGFHVDCIDMWFQSHSTCPLCRNPVANPNPSDSGAESTILQLPNMEGSAMVTPPNFPTNVLFWGDETQVSTFGPSVGEHHRPSAEPSTSSSSSSSSSSTSNRPDGVLVIDIPRQVNEEEDQKSSVPTRFRSLKRLLSGSRRVNPSSPRNLDLEQGNRSQI